MVLPLVVCVLMAEQLVQFQQRTIRVGSEDFIVGVTNQREERVPHSVLSGLDAIDSSVHRYVSLSIEQCRRR
jgi:hypothetical protein